MASSSRMSPAQAPPHKRARIHACSRGEDDYMRGNIMKIELHNFMTYDHVETRPGPRLNLVIGPNGTGKSSLVCAIAIGLGGDTQILGRSKSIGDFVKRGEESGWTRISLRGNVPEETIVITRNINRQNKSEWLIDGRSATKKAVQDAVKQFNIQVNNLTQFLPQDRVCEFAKMNPIELLKETEKAVGDPELSNQHSTLVDRSQEVKQRQATVSTLEKKLNRLRASNAELERDVERVQKRNQLNERAEAMKKKLPWLIYDQEKANYLEVKARMAESRQRLNEVQEQLKTLQVPIAKQKRKRDASEKESRTLRSRKQALEKAHKGHGTREHDLRVEVVAKVGAMENVRRSEAQRLRRMENAQKAVDDAQAALAEMAHFEVPKEEMERLAMQIGEIETKAQEKRQAISDLRALENQARAQIATYRSRIEQIQNKTNQRLRTLKETLHVPHIFEAYQWVEEHRHEFRKDVYGPVLLEVGIPTKEKAAFIEGHVQNYIWKAFITQDAEDRDLLHRSIQVPFGVPVINQTEPARAAARITPELVALGVEGTLDELISGPDVVKACVVGQFGLHASFHGGASANRNAEEINNLGVQDLWTPDNHFRWQKSLYGGPVSASVRPVRQARLFSPSVDRQALEELERAISEAEATSARLKEDLQTLNIEHRVFEEERAPLEREREKLVEDVRQHKKNRAELRYKYEQRLAKLEALKNEEDLETITSRQRADIVELNGLRFENALEMKKSALKLVELHFGLNVHLLASAEQEARLKAMERALREEQSAGTRAQIDFNAVEEEYKASKERLNEKKRVASAVVVPTPEMQASFADMPDTVEDLRDAIEDLMAQARAVFCGNPNALQEYEERCSQIKEASGKLELETAALNGFLEEIEQIKALWLNSLRSMVQKINLTFGRNFREMAVAGEVSLDEQGTDFDKYGILIKVKFREAGELQVLSAHHQSGGERSVSTILYLISLQDLTHCPFRVVDEINQGMDPINERKMFQQLVSAASQPNTPQCFLLTPKLLPELTYSDACSVLNIMNGPWIEASAELWKGGNCYSEICGMAKASAMVS